MRQSYTTAADLKNLHVSYFKTAAIAHGLRGDTEQALSLIDSAINADSSDRNSLEIKAALRW